jgi:integrase
LNLELPWLDTVVRASRPKRLPVVLSRTEVRRVIAALDGPYFLIASLMYGSGLRLMESLRLRYKDIDLERAIILVRNGKGAKDRVTVLPESLREQMRNQLELVRERHSYARSHGFAGVQELMGHASVRTTQSYTHVLNRGGIAARSPLD